MINDCQALLVYLYQQTYDVAYKQNLKIPKRYSYPEIEEQQTTQWPKEKGQKDKQRSKKHTHKTKDQVTRTSLKPGENPGAPER